MNNLMMFEETNVEIFELDGKVLFNPYDIGNCLEMAESTIRNHLSKMNEKQVRKIKNNEISNVRLKDNRKIHNTGENFIT